MKRIQFEIDEELYQRIRFRLLFENRKMKEYLRQSIMDDMAAYEAKVLKEKGRLPYPHNEHS